MAFNYDSLKRITSDSIVDGNVQNSDIANNAVTTAKIANSAVGSNKLATNAVNLGTNVVTGSAAVAKGGTGLTSVGSANQALTINSSNNGLVYAPTGLYGMQVFTWNRPSGVRYIHIALVGGGGAGSGHGESGGAGGYAERILDVTGISSSSVSISGESNGTYYSGAGGNGGGSSFGPYLSSRWWIWSK